MDAKHEQTGTAEPDVVTEVDWDGLLLDLKRLRGRALPPEAYRELLSLSQKCLTTSLRSWGEALERCIQATK